MLDGIHESFRDSIWSLAWDELMFFFVAVPKSGQEAEFQEKFPEWMKQLATGHRIFLPAVVLAVCLPPKEAENLQRSHAVENGLVPLDKALALAEQLTYLLHQVVGPPLARAVPVQAHGPCT